MADLKVGTTIGGSPVWHQGNLALVPSGNAILYKGARIYSENDKPSANELQVVSRAGDTMSGVLNIETSADYPLALKSSVSGPAYIRFSKGNTLQSYVGTDAAGEFKVAMTDANGSWAFDGLKIAKSNGDVSLKGALVSANTGNFDIKYGSVQFIRANSAKDLYIGSPGGTHLILGYAQDGMTTTKIRFDSAVYNKTGGLLISDTGLIQRSAMDNPYYNQTESDTRFIRLNVNTATNGYLLSKSVNIGDANNLNMGYSGFFRHGGLDGFRGLTINVAHSDVSNGAHSRGITFDYGSTGYGMYTYAYDSTGTKLANQKIYTEADKPTPAEIGALAAGANAVSASKLQTARTISLTGGATGSVSFDGSANASLAVTVTNDSHTHSDYVKKIGDTMSGNLTVPKVLLSAAQGAEANSVARRDFVESTVTASGKGVKDLTIALPAGAPTSGYIPVLFKTYGTSNTFVFIDTLSSTSSYPMNNCSFIGNVRASGWTDSGSYAYGMFTIHSESERAIHSIHGPSESVNGFVVYVETRAFPITVRVDVGTTVTAYATDATYGTSVFKVNGQVSGNTKTVIFANFDKGAGIYNGSNRVYDNGYNPTPEAVGALPVNGNAVTASRLQTARLIAGIPFDGTSNISISATNVGALPITGGTLTGVLNVPRLEISGTAAGITYDGSNKNIIRSGTGAAIVIGNFTDITYIDSLNGDVKVRPAGSTEYKIYHEGNKPTLVELGAAPSGYGIGAAGALMPDANALPNVGGIFAASGAGSLNYANKYSPIIQAFRPGGDDASGQVLQIQELDGSIAVRNRNGGNWTSWNKLYGERNRPTPGDVGAVNKTGDSMSGQLILTPSFVDTSVYAQLAHIGKDATKPLYIRNMREHTSSSWLWEKVYNGSLYYSSGTSGSGTNKIRLQVSGSGEIYLGSNADKRVYHEGFKPTPDDIGAVNKTGDAMSGSLVINKSDWAILLNPEPNTASYILGQQGGVASWYIGKGSPSSDDITLNSYTHSTSISLASDRIDVNKNIVTSVAQSALANALTRKDYVDAAVDTKASNRVNFATGLGTSRAITGTTVPTHAGVWAVNNSTWTPTTYGSLLVTTNRSDELTTTGSGSFIHYLFISHNGARVYSATNVNGSWSGWKDHIDSGGGQTINGLITATDVLITSDRRLKSKLEVIDNALDKVNSLVGFTYDKEGRDSREAGLIAQEVQAVLPEAIGTTSDKNYGDVLTISHSSVQALVVNAINELLHIVKSQGNEIKQLKDKIMEVGE